METQMARPRVRQDKKTGKWIVEYYDTNKKQHRLKGFPTKRAANDRADEISGEVRKGVHTPASVSGTVADACQSWIKRGHRLKLEPETMRSYQNHVDLHLLPLTDSSESPDKPAWEGKLGDLRLSKLTPPLANAVLRELQDRLSLPMARKVMSSFKAILDEAANHGMIAYNPASTVKMRRRDRGENKVHIGVDFPTKEEMAAIIDMLDGRWRPVILVLAFCGVRSSELRGLEWDDLLGLDSDVPQLRVRQRADKMGRIGDTKSPTAHRLIPLTRRAAAELRAWKTVCPREAETGELRFVCPNGNGIVENHANISNRGWKEWQIAAGVCVPRRDDEGKSVRDKDGNSVVKAKYGVHALRHFFASLMIDQGFGPKRVQALLGHATIQMTLDVYSHLFPPDQEDDRNRFANAEASVLNAAK
jgi:integrase